MDDIKRLKINEMFISFENDDSKSTDELLEKNKFNMYKDIVNFLTNNLHKTELSNFMNLCCQ
jgi:hypothetical protein